MPTRSRYVVRIALVTLCLAIVAGTSSCIDQCMPFVSRTVLIPPDAVPCVRDALRSDGSWTPREFRRGIGATPEGMMVLDLPTAGGVVEVKATIDGNPPHLALLSYIGDAVEEQEEWEEKKAARRESLRRVYTRLRESCPDLGPWSASTESCVDPWSAQRSARAIPGFLLVVGAILYCGVVFVLLVVWLVRSPRRRGTQDERMIWHRKRSGEGGTPGASKGKPG